MQSHSQYESRSRGVHRAKLDNLPGAHKSVLLHLEKYRELLVQIQTIRNHRDLAVSEREMVVAHRVHSATSTALESACLPQEASVCRVAAIRNETVRSERYVLAGVHLLPLPVPQSKALDHFR